eukprot:4187195-Ditylum_brightwellii.AAC.1
MGALTAVIFDANKQTPLTHSKKNALSTIIGTFCNVMGIPGIDNVSADEEALVHSELTDSTNIEEIMEESGEENDNGEDSSVISGVKNPKIQKSTNKKHTSNVVLDMLIITGNDTNSMVSAVTGVEISTTAQSDISVASAMIGVDGMASATADMEGEIIAQECTSIASVMTRVEAVGTEISTL